MKNNDLKIKSSWTQFLFIIVIVNKIFMNSNKCTRKWGVLSALFCLDVATAVNKSGKAA